MSKLWELVRLECYSPWGRKESDTTEQFNNNKDKVKVMLILLKRSMLILAEVCGFPQSLSKRGLHDF